MTSKAEKKISDLAKAGGLANKSSKEVQDLFLKTAQEIAAEQEEPPKKPGSSDYVLPDYDGPEIPPHILPYVLTAREAFTASVKAHALAKALTQQSSSLINKVGVKYVKYVFMK